MKFTVPCGQQDGPVLSTDEFDGRFTFVQGETDGGAKGEGVRNHGEPVFGVFALNAVPT